MDDFNKIFNGIGKYDKLLSQSNAVNPLITLSNPLNIPNWILKGDENLTMKAITGNSLQLWEALTKMPKVPDYRGISAIMDINHWINNSRKPNPFLDSLVTLSTKTNWASSANHPSLNQANNWSKSLLTSNSTIEILSKYKISTDWYKSSNIWSGLIYPQPIKQKKDETISTNIERFANNVVAVYSEVENFDEPQKIKFASNITEVLTYEVESTKYLPTYSLVLEWILKKYNDTIESAIATRNIDELKNIYSELKEKTIVGWLSIILAIGMCGVIESNAGKLWDSITGTGDVDKPQVIYNTTISYNATTNSLRPLLIEPDGRTKTLCIIPDCTEVQLGEIVGKYIQITLLHNGTIIRGWCLNKEFTISKQLP